MRAVLITAVLAFTLLGLLVAGCARNAPGTVITPDGQAPQKAADNSISGDISSVDSLDLELDSSELGDVDAQLDEIDW